MRIEMRNFRINVQAVKATYESDWLLFVVEKRNFLVGGEINFYIRYSENRETLI
jgi:hypothetical protein